MKKRNLFLFVSGRLISLVGSGIQMIALPLFILDRTGSGAMMGILTVLSMLPAMVFAPLAGALGDKLNRKALAIVADCCRGALILVLAALAYADRLAISTLFIFQVLVSINDSFFNAATATMLPDLIEAQDYGKAGAATGGADNLSMIVGPMLGGVIYGLWGIQMVFLVNAVSFLISAFCECLIVYRPVIRDGVRLTLKSLLAEMGETLGLVKQKPGLRELFFFSLFTSLLITPVFIVGMPFVLRKVIGLSPGQYGYLMTAFTVGALLANIVLGILLARARTGRLMKSGLTLAVVLLMGLAGVFFPRVVSWLGGPGWTLFGVIAGGFVLTGFFNAFVNTPLLTNLQWMVPAEMRARFFAVLGLLAQLAIPIGSLIYGFSLDLVPSHWLLLGVCVVNMVVTLAFMTWASPEAFEPAISAEPGL